MIHIELNDMFIHQPVFDDKFYEDKPFRMSVIFSGPLRFIRDDWETSVQIEDIKVSEAVYDGKPLEKDVLEEIEYAIKANLMFIVTVCTDETVKLSNDGLLEAAYEALDGLDIL